MNHFLKKISAYGSLMRLHRPIGIYLLLWPTLWALWIAGNGKPSLKVVLIFIVGVIIMRSAGCIINDYIDRKIDIHVARTRERPLAVGSVSRLEALTLFFSLCVLALVLVLQLNLFTVQLSVIAVLLTIIYPFMKRYIYLPQLILGMAYAWGVPMAFAALQESIDPVAWFLYAIAVIWPFAYDSIYALMDREDDAKIGVKSSVMLFARYDNLIITLLQLLVITSLICLGFFCKFSVYYFFSLMLTFVLIVYQSFLISTKQIKNYYLAFYSNHWMGMIIFIGIVFNYLLQDLHLTK